MASSRLPDLGPHGEGWFGVQVVLFAAIALAGAVGPAWSGSVRVAGALVGVACMALGGLLGLRGVLDLRENLTPFPKPLERATLVRSGAYSLVRHPIYGGLILGAVGWGLLTASPLALGGAVLLAGFFRLKSAREEAWLEDKYDGYAAYRARTRRFVPWLY